MTPGTHKASYREPWARGQRCIIPARSFDEPSWETGKSVWWRLRPAAGGLWGLAGLWNTSIDHTTGEVHESYTMLTVKADKHPLMRRMHKPKPKLPADHRDKRGVIPIPLADTAAWTGGTARDAATLFKLPAEELFAVEQG